MNQYQRDVAKYVFANELRNSNISRVIEREDSQFSSTHVITPTGQDLGRVFLCGTLIEIEDVGTDSPYYKARIVDQTGAIAVYAGEYQPKATQALELIEPPVYISVVGKVNLFETPDGTKIPSIKAETVAVVDADVIKTWTFMAARNLITHLEDPAVDKEFKKTALDHYGDVANDYKITAMDAIKSMINGGENTE